MTLSQFASALGRAAIITRDINAVRRGRIAERVGNRVIGGTISRFMRGRWF